MILHGGLVVQDANWAHTIAMPSQKQGQSAIGDKDGLSSDSRRRMAHARSIVELAMLGCIDIEIVLLCLGVQRFGMPCSPPHCVIVCACVLLGIIGIQPSKVSATLALADAKVKVFAGDGNCFCTATALECARCVGKPIREDSFARCRQVCLELVWRGLRDEMSIGGG